MVKERIAGAMILVAAALVTVLAFFQIYYLGCSGDADLCGGATLHTSSSTVSAVGTTPATWDPQADSSRGILALQVFQTT